MSATGESGAPGAGGEDRAVSPAEITAQVIARFDSCADPRLREIMQALVAHLHGFVTEVGLTEAEWAAAIGELTATGHITDDKRQEFILWSDSLGVSMLVDALAHPAPDGATESTVLGPFYVAGSPLRPYGADIAEQEAGVPAWVHGRVLDTGGEEIVIISPREQLAGFWLLAAAGSGLPSAAAEVESETGRLLSGDDVVLGARIDPVFAGMAAVPLW